MTHSATKLDSILKRYGKIADSHHFNKEAIHNAFDEGNHTSEEERQLQANFQWFNQAYEITRKKMDLVRQLIELEERFPTSAFL